MHAEQLVRQLAQLSAVDALKSTSCYVPMGLGKVERSSWISVLAHDQPSLLACHGLRIPAALCRGACEAKKGAGEGDRSNGSRQRNCCGASELPPSEKTISVLVLKTAQALNCAEVTGQFVKRRINPAQMRLKVVVQGGPSPCQRQPSARGLSNGPQ